MAILLMLSPLLFCVAFCIALAIIKIVKGN